VRKSETQTICDLALMSSCALVLHARLPPPTAIGVGHRQPHSWPFFFGQPRSNAVIAFDNRSAASSSGAAGS
jgi:hypothetical protein